MKIRTGFVSNSSTTSFCIYGMDIEEENLKNEINDDFNEWIDALSEKIDLEIHYGYDSDPYLGISWCNIKDDETGKELKERVEEILKKYLKEVKCYTIDIAYRDG